MLNRDCRILLFPPVVGVVSRTGTELAREALGHSRYVNCIAVGADASSGSFTKSVSVICPPCIGIFQRHLVLRRKLLCVEGVLRKLHSEPVAGRGAGEEMR